ncbi:MAG TPA: hypothetical protein VIL04_05405 [Solirubrobacterales bacterium]|jgi:hypothetical protein
MIIKPWLFPFIMLAVLAAVVAGFWLGGPPLGTALGALAAASIALFAALQRPRGPIGPAATGDSRRRVLVVVSHELEDPAAIERLREEGDLYGDSDTEVLLLAPAQTKLLDLWATDVRAARAEAQRKLVLSVAALGKAEVDARAAVGDHDIVRAIEDQLGSFAADEVILVTGPPDSDQAGERAAAELEERLTVRFMRITVAA